ncbi:MAG: hypothetical protein KC503_12530 [Myxococcales bacterium]|nr:hypothetical protein [Myxococcales bacterium]
MRCTSPQTLILSLLLASYALLAPARAAAQQQQEQQHVRLGVLPSRALNVEAAERARLDALLRARLRDGRQLELVTGADLGKALAGRDQSCVDDAACLVDVGKRVGAPRILAPRFGRLAETLILRLTVYETQSGTRQGSWQQVLTKSDDKSLRVAFDRMLDGFAPKPRAARRFYQRWWFWTAIGAAVVGGTVTAIVLATRGESPTDEINPFKP